MHLMHNGFNPLILEEVLMEVKLGKAMLASFKYLTQLHCEKITQVHLIKDDLAVDAQLPAQFLEPLGLNRIGWDPQVFGFRLKEGLHFGFCESRQLIINYIVDFYYCRVDLLAIINFIEEARNIRVF